MAQTTAAVLPQFEQSLRQLSTKNTEFGDSFEPNLLEGGDRPYGWTRKDNNSWEGGMLDDGDKEIGTATLTVENEALISVVSEVELAMMMNSADDPNLAPMFPPGCSAQMNMQISHGG